VRGLLALGVWKVMRANVLLALALGVALLFALDRSAHADPESALDRQLVERMVRALEDQARATDKLVQATERCKR
jgi:hypothetical protein